MYHDVSWLYLFAFFVVVIVRSEQPCHSFVVFLPSGVKQRNRVAQIIRAWQLVPRRVSECTSKFVKILDKCLLLQKEIYCPCNCHFANVENADHIKFSEILIGSWKKDFSHSEEYNVNWFPCLCQLKLELQLLSLQRLFYQDC